MGSVELATDLLLPFLYSQSEEVGRGGKTSKKLSSGITFNEEPDAGGEHGIIASLGLLVSTSVKTDYLKKRDYFRGRETPKKKNEGEKLSEGAVKKVSQRRKREQQPSKICSRKKRGKELRGNGTTETIGPTPCRRKEIRPV